VRKELRKAEGMAPTMVGWMVGPLALTPVASKVALSAASWVTKSVDKMAGKSADYLEYSLWGQPLVLLKVDKMEH
jgi:hypothetical protein